MGFLQLKKVKIVPYQLLSTIWDFMSNSLSKKTNGKITKYINKVRACIKKLKILLSCPKINVPRNMTKKPSDSTNQAKNVIWMLRIFRRCRLAFDESAKSLLNLIIDSL